MSTDTTILHRLLGHQVEFSRDGQPTLGHVVTVTCMEHGSLLELLTEDGHVHQRGAGNITIPPGPAREALLATAPQPAPSPLPEK